MRMRTDATQEKIIYGTRSPVGGHLRPTFHRFSRWFVLCFLLPSTPAVLVAQTNEPIAVKFINVAAQAGIRARTIYGDERKNKYLLETTGSGAAFIDYDGDGWQDIFLVNGTRLGALPPEQA